MKLLISVSQDYVWRHWMGIQKTKDVNFHSDIRNPIPEDIQCYTAEIEEHDIDCLYIISSGDWIKISENTFRIRQTAKRLNIDSIDHSTVRISKDIQEK
jgi:hypothetical protein